MLAFSLISFFYFFILIISFNLSFKRSKGQGLWLVFVGGSRIFIFELLSVSYKRFQISPSARNQKYNNKYKSHKSRFVDDFTDRIWHFACNGLNNPQETYNQRMILLVLFVLWSSNYLKRSNSVKHSKF